MLYFATFFARFAQKYKRFFFIADSLKCVKSLTCYIQSIDRCLYIAIKLGAHLKIIRLHNKHYYEHLNMAFLLQFNQDMKQSMSFEIRI